MKSLLQQVQQEVDIAIQVTHSLQVTCSNIRTLYFRALRSLLLEGNSLAHLPCELGNFLYDSLIMTRCYFLLNKYNVLVLLSDAILNATYLATLTWEYVV